MARNKSIRRIRSIRLIGEGREGKGRGGEGKNPFGKVDRGRNDRHSNLCAELIYKISYAMFRYLRWVFALHVTCPGSVGNSPAILRKITMV